MNKNLSKKLSLLVLLGVTITQTPINVNAETTAINLRENSNSVAMLAADTTAPATFQISKDKWDGECDFSIKMNLWWGANGDVFKLYENGKLIKEVPLVNASPNPQSTSVSFTSKSNGTYVYTAELVNSIGVTQSQGSVTHVVTKNTTPIDIQLPSFASGTPITGYKVLNEDDKTFEWAVYVANPNKGYVWDGSDFSVWNVKFTTENEITSVSNAKAYTVNGQEVTIELKQDERLLDYNTIRVFTVKGNKKSTKAPSNFKATEFRGDISYPNYSDLPSSWSKNKVDLSEKDLIANPSAYYNTSVKTNSGNKLLYSNPVSDTQLIFAMPKEMPQPINGVNKLRIWMPSKYLAMGIGTSTEFFGLNPNFMVGLSIKENFTCGLAPKESGYNENPITLDGKEYSWPIQKLHPDGPFQQEAGNFNEVKKQFKDYLPTSAAHSTYVGLKTGEPEDPSYVHSAISSAISLTMTREFLYAIPKNDFANFIKNSKDPWAEFVLVDNAYNRGVYGLLQRNLFTVNRDKAINSTDINKDFDLSGFANHIENIENVIKAMDAESTNIYDSTISWSEMENYLNQLRLYYGNGVPNDTEWNAMKADVKKGFDILSKHWGDNTVSLRYDFLTLLRIAEKYLPEDRQPSPSGASWIEQVNSANQ